MAHPGLPKERETARIPPEGEALEARAACLARLDGRGDLVFDPFCGSGTTTGVAKELNRAFVGAELEEQFAKLAGRRVAATKRGSLLRQISKQFWNGA